MYLKEYLRAGGLKSAKELAKKTGLSHQYLYQIASGKRKASPEVAVAIHKGSNGQVPYFKTLEHKVDRVWPTDMFIYHEAWKQKK